MSLMGRSGGRVGPWIQGAKFSESWLVLVWHSMKVQIFIHIVKGMLSEQYTGKNLLHCR